jgi:L-lactate dehydrogenase complex protein LldE
MTGRDPGILVAASLTGPYKDTFFSAKLRAMRRVGLFVSCLIDQFYPQVGFRVVEVLERLGFDVVVPENQSCCGQPAFNSGYADEARPVLRSAFECLKNADVEAIVVPSGSCSAMFRVFSHELIGHQPVVDKVFEFSEFLVRFAEPEELDAAFHAKIVYHDSCHQLRALREPDAPRRILRQVRGLHVLELPEAVCCGFGGTFSMKMPELSGEMRSDKIEAILASGAEAVVSTDMGCLMHLSAGLKARQSTVRTLHIAEVLASS